MYITFEFQNMTNSTLICKCTLALGLLVTSVLLLYAFTNSYIYIHLHPAIPKDPSPSEEKLTTLKNTTFSEEKLATMKDSTLSKKELTTLKNSTLSEEELETLKQSTLSEKTLATLKESILSEEELVILMEQSSPSLPYQFWSRNREKFTDSTCGSFPHVLDIQWRDRNWQIFQQPHQPPIYLFSAYIDNRLKHTTTVRVIAVNEQLQNLLPKLVAQLWYDNSTSAVTANLIEWPKYKQYGAGAWVRGVAGGAIKPELFSFRISNSGEFPGAISLVSSACDKATNMVKIIPPPSIDHNKTNIGVCVHGYSYTNDDSIDNIQWFEMLKILGVDKVHLYIYNVHPKVLEVFKYYQNQGFADITNISVPDMNAPNIPGLQTKWLYRESYTIHRWSQDKVSYNDCFYKNMNNHKYIAIIDMDEVIVPRKHMTWVEMLEDLGGDEAAYLFHMAHYPKTGHPGNTKAPKYLSMLHQLNRGPYQNTKAIVKTESASYMHNHTPQGCLPDDGRCKIRSVPADVATVHHYQKKYDCGENYSACAQFPRDERIFFYQDKLIENVRQVLRNLELT